MLAVVEDTEKFQQALARVASTVSKSDSNPLDSAVKVWTQGQRLLITAVDPTAHQLTLAVDARVDAPGAVLTEADYFSKVLSRIGKEPLVFRHDDPAKLSVKCGIQEWNFNLFAVSVDQFQMENVLPEQVASVDGEELHDFTKSLLLGTVNKEQDIGFVSVPDADKLRGYTGDHTVGMLLRCECPLMGKQTDFSFKVPFNVLRKLPLLHGTLTVHVGNNLVVFARGDEHFLLRVPSTNAPQDDLDFLFDQVSMGYVTLDLKALRETAAAVKVSKTNQIARVTIDAESKKLVVEAVDTSRGDGKRRVNVDEINGQSPRLLVDANSLEKGATAVGHQAGLVNYLLYKGDEYDVWSMQIVDEANPKKKQAVILPVVE